MKNETYFFEIKDLITQFIAAFDDVVIERFNKNRQPEQRVEVRYVYAPKQRVIYDIVNQAKNITLPVVSVSISNISRDLSRVFNKIDGFYYGKSDGTQTKVSHLLSPVPINISVSMSIVTKYQTDMDQILSNFVPYTNPYIVIGWKVPEDLGLSLNQEIRSEVLWDGSIALSYPTDLSSTDKYRCSADTSFTIKGWLFKSQQSPKGIIYYINNNFNVESKITNYDTLSGNSYSWPISTGMVTETEFVGVSANP